MKFTNIKKNHTLVATLSLVLFINTNIKPANAVEDKRVECGRRVGITLAQCLFIPNDQTFLDDVQEFRKIIQEYCSHFDPATVHKVMAIINAMESYIKDQRNRKKHVNPTNVATYLKKLIDSLPDNVSGELTKAFEICQVKILKRKEPLGAMQLLGPLSNRLNKKTNGTSQA